MQYYLCQVRYDQLGEVKSFVHHEYATSHIRAAENIQNELTTSRFVTFNVNDRKDRFILQSEHVLNVVVMSA